MSIVLTFTFSLHHESTDFNWEKEEEINKP